MAAELTLTPTEQDVYRRTEAALARNRRDLPFVLLYLYDDELPLARRVALTGLPPDDPCAPAVIADDTDGGWPSAQARRGREEIELLDLPTRFPHLAAAFGGRTPRSAMVLPLVSQADARPTGFLVAALNPQRPLDEGLRSYVRLVGNQVESAVASARALDAERRRAEALAELDRVKTQFFANISHEFRTPLTLLMGPLAELQRALPDGDDAIADNLAIMHRNALRLGKLVNAVLDFSRLQAGHEHARFEPLDLAMVTADLASMFSPAIEQAGLRLTVDCEAVDEPVYVDPSMWEKIVLNLLSNAFKFTLVGEITVRLRRVGDRAVLTVRDTGVGIPEHELPHLFERFHRVERSRARSAEGTGIGLALVAELIELHGGSVSVASVPDQGTVFAVEIPLGRAHLPHDPVLPTGGSLPRTTAPDAFLSEALRWIPDHTGSDVVPGAPDAANAAAGEVLVVDDNADMRAYLARLLRARFSVRTAANGAEAIAAIGERVPDLVLSDVMMPEVDGIELVRHIRAELGLTDLPVILLTAASGPDATTEGLDVGADDYLVKPFTADDLLGRVAARMTVGAERRQRQALTDLAVSVAACTDVGEVVREVHRFVAAHLGADISSLAVVDDGEVVRIEHSSRFAGGINERYRTGTTRSAGPLFAPLRTGQAVVLNDLAAVEAAFPESLSDFREGGVASAVSTPLVRANGEVMGTLASSWSAPRTIDPADVTLHQRTAAALVDTLERLRAAAQEHRLLHHFQSQLLAIDQRSTLGALAARYQPAEAGLLVGGDWYDVMPFPDGAIGLSVGDVVGKGLPAATVMSQLRSALRLAAITAESPGRAVSMLDGYARQVPAALGASSTFLRIEPGGRLCWSTAGHPPLMVVVDDDVRMLTGGRRPVLGAADPGAVSEGCIDLTPGSLVLLYTDGLVERRGEGIDTGLARLCDAVAEHGHLSVGRLCEQLVRTMSPAGGFADDVAVLAFRTTGATRDRFVEALPARPTTLAPARRRFRAWLTHRARAARRSTISCWPSPNC